MQTLSKQTTKRLTKAYENYDNAWQKIKDIENEIRAANKIDGGIYKSPKDEVTNRHYYIYVSPTVRDVRSFTKGDTKELVVKIWYSANRCTRYGLTRGHSYQITPDELSKFTLVEKPEGKSA